MKTLLFDFTNFGIVHVVEYPSRWPVTMLRCCIVDTHPAVLPVSHPLYNEITNESIRKNFYQFSRTNTVFPGNPGQINEYFLEKQRLAELMMPPIFTLIQVLHKRSFNTLNDHGIALDDTLAFEILKSDPDNNVYSQGILEYANTLEITPHEAYKELRIEYESVHRIKLRAYATEKKYQALIRQIRTAEDSQQLCNEINQKLFNDTFV